MLIYLEAVSSSSRTSKRRVTANTGHVLKSFHTFMEVFVDTATAATQAPGKLGKLRTGTTIKCYFIRTGLSRQHRLRINET